MDIRIQSAMVVVLLAGSTAAYAAVPSALIREADDMGNGRTVSSLSTAWANGVGGYAFNGNLDDAGNSVGFAWGSADGVSMPFIRREEGTVGDFEQTAFEGFFGMDNSGSIAYGTTSNRLSDGATGLDGVWKDDTPLLHETESVPAAPGEFSSFNSRPYITHNGHTWWVGGITGTSGGSTADRALFIGDSSNIVLRGGDAIGGVSELVDTGSSNIAFDTWVSANKTHYLTEVLVDSSTTNDAVVVLDGNALMVGGSIVREDSPVPAAAGGLPGELWDNFDFHAVNEAGDTLFTGDTTAASAFDEIIVKNGQIILRDGDTIGSPDGDVTVNGSIEVARMNEQGDWAAIWDVDLPDGLGNVEALIVNGEAVLLEGMKVDWNNDGVIDIMDNNGTIVGFSGIASMGISARDGNFVDIYFTADIDFNGTSSTSDDLEGGFVYRVQIPTPGGAMLLGLAGLAATRRRR